MEQSLLAERNGNTIFSNTVQEKKRKKKGKKMKEEIQKRDQVSRDLVFYRPKIILISVED